MSWTLVADDQYRLEGWAGATVFTATRQLKVAAGPADVTALRAVVERCGAEPSVLLGMEQVHGGHVVVADDARDTVLPACDGLVTARPNVALAMRSADCLPIIAYDPTRRVIGLAHAGWRGVKAQLPVQMVTVLTRRFGSRPADLRLAIGPGIGPCCYAVGPEFDPWFPRALQVRAGQRFLDLAAAVRAQLAPLGIPAEAIDVAPWCTACTPLHCESYRRDGAAAGRLVTAALLR